MATLLYGYLLMLHGYSNSSRMTSTLYGSSGFMNSSVVNSSTQRSNTNHRFTLSEKFTRWSTSIKEYNRSHTTSQPPLSPQLEFHREEAYRTSVSGAGQSLPAAEETVNETLRSQIEQEHQHYNAMTGMMRTPQRNASPPLYEEYALRRQNSDILPDTCSTASSAANLVINQQKSPS